MASQIPQVTRQARIPLPASSAGQPGAPDRSSRLVLRRLDPWSVLKFSLLFYFCMLLVGLLVFAVIWLVLVNMGVFESVARFAGNFNLDLGFPAGGLAKYGPAPDRVVTHPATGALPGRPARVPVGVVVGLG